jgi:hypothetical protein
MLFFPLIAYSSICLVLLLTAPVRFARHFPVRLGIYTGILLSLQYAMLTLLLAISTPFIFLGLFWIAATLLFEPTAKWLKNRWGIASAGWWLFGFLALAFIAGMWIPFFSPVSVSEFFTTLPAGLLAVTLFAAPFWCLYIMICTAARLFADHDRGKLITLRRSVGAVSWLAGFLVAWRFDLWKMAAMYAALPKTPPDCYVATSAAQGHPRLVRSHPIRLANGEWMRINRQLQILKLAELALLAARPPLHEKVRTFYDVVGCAIACRIDTPLLADMVYLSLKPFEWSAWLGLRLLLPESDRLAARLYGAGKIIIST